MTVVVGVDGSPDSYAAIRLASQEAAYRGGRLAAVMAYPSESAMGTPAARPLSIPNTPDQQRQTAESTLREAVRQALGDADNIELRVEAGAPGHVLVETARSLKADLMVLATRSEHAPSRLLGAVSQYVLRKAPCPVLVVPEASKEL